LLTRIPFRCAYWLAVCLATACSVSVPTVPHPELAQTVRIEALHDEALSWHIPQVVPVLRGARLISDAPRPASRTLALTKAILRSNKRLQALDALRLASLAASCAREAGLDVNFFGATILQESAFDPFAVSSAFALGIAQFTLETADAFSVDPLEPRSALAGSARLLSSYVARYRRRGAANPYALALAAYNAGPLAVAHYRGIPPYPETRTYIDDIDDRLARIVKDERR